MLSATYPQRNIQLNAVNIVTLNRSLSTKLYQSVLFDCHLCSFPYPTSCLTAERNVDEGWVLLSSGFVFFSGRSVMGECLGVMCITITLLLHPTPLLIFLAVARLNRLNPWTDWYIGACQRRCEELSLLFRCHCHYFIPPPLHSPFPTSYQGDRS